MRLSGVPREIADAEAKLLAPGALFETEEATVLGERMHVFKRRPASLRALLDASRAFGNAEYLVFTDGERERRFTFAKHAALVATAARRMRVEWGIRKGDRVAIVGANAPEWIVFHWAAVSIGAIVVGMNAWWTEAELRYALDDAEPSLIVADARRAERIGKTQAPLLAFEGAFDGLAEFGERGGAAGAESWLPEETIDEDDPAIVLYTSGTTGRSKGAVHSHRNVLALLMMNAFHGARMRLAFPPPEEAGPTCVLVTSPLFHVSGLHSAAVACLAGGVRSVWLAGRFDPALALRVIEQEKVTGWGFTSALLHRIVHHADATRRDLGSVRHLGGGGSPIAPALQERTREVFPSVRRTLGVGYGLTECSALATLNPGDELASRPDSVGRPMPTVEIAVRDEAGAVAADGVDGEVYVRGPGVMLEYWRDPVATAASIGEGRWLRTGDVGKIEDGRLFLASRKRDLILRGGENVYPVEIEQRLEAHPGIAEAAVVGVEHAELGQEVKAIVVPVTGARLDVEDLRTWVAEAIAYFKVPAHWEIREDALPRNAMGKVLKRELGG